MININFQACVVFIYTGLFNIMDTEFIKAD